MSNQRGRWQAQPPPGLGTQHHEKIIHSNSSLCGQGWARECLFTVAFPSWWPMWAPCLSKQGFSSPSSDTAWAVWIYSGSGSCNGVSREHRVSQQASPGRLTETSTSPFGSPKGGFASLQQLPLPDMDAVFPSHSQEDFLSFVHCDFLSDKWSLGTVGTKILTE